MVWQIVLNLLVLAGIALLLRELRTLRRGEATTGLQQRVQDLEQLLAIVPTPLVVLDRGGRCLDSYPANEKTQALAWLTQLGEGDRRTLHELVAEAVDRHKRTTYRLQIDERAVLADILPLEASGDKPRAAAVCLRDVTEQEDSAARAGKLAVRNRAILRSAMDGFFVVDEDHRFLEVNDAFCRMTGYTAEELLQLRITELEVKEPSLRQTDASPFRTGLHQFATAHRHRDGHIIRLETSVIVLRDEGRRILVGFARDVTERLRAEEALEKLSRQNKLILDSAGEGIYGVDTEGRITFANPAAARQLGWETQELIGMCAHELVRHARLSTQPCQDLECIVCGSMRTGAMQRVADHVFRRRDGSVLPVDFVSAPIFERGVLTGAVIVFRDVSERKQAEEERRQLEARFQQAQKLESLGMLAGGLAHDFNNLLLSVLCNASLASEKLEAESEIRDYLDKIVKSGRRASELTRQMLAYSGQATYDVAPLALNGLVAEIADLVRAALPKLVQLQLDLAPELPNIEADGTQVQQVVMNLLINAGEAIGNRAGRVTARTSMRVLSTAELKPNYVGHPLTAGPYVCLEVVDDGCGMTTETLARIFDPFFTTKATGRGLGLSALLGIVRSHHGAVHVDSAPGAGTTFTVLFPPATARPTVRRAPAREYERLPPGSTVLVVDDEPDIREVVQAVLEARGARVLVAEDGMAGIAQFRAHAHEVDIVLLDMTMPGMGGEVVFREILSIRPDARVVVASGYTEQDALARLDDDRRMAGFVHKPYTAQALVDKIGAALDGEAHGALLPAPGHEM